MYFHCRTINTSLPIVSKSRTCFAVPRPRLLSQGSQVTHMLHSLALQEEQTGYGLGKHIRFLCWPTNVIGALKHHTFILMLEYYVKKPSFASLNRPLMGAEQFYC